MTNKHDAGAASSINRSSAGSDSEREQALIARDDITDPGGR